MGNREHNAIVVCGTDNGELRAARNFARSLFPYVTNVVKGTTNGYASFMVGPSGSSIGREGAIADEAGRDKLVIYLRDTLLSWVEIRFASDLRPTAITRYDQVARPLVPQWPSTSAPPRLAGLVSIRSGPLLARELRTLPMRVELDVNDFNNHVWVEPWVAAVITALRGEHVTRRDVRAMVNVVARVMALGQETTAAIESAFALDANPVELRDFLVARGIRFARKRQPALMNGAIE